MRFSSAFRAIVPVMAVLLASGCALLIPDDPSQPRYNQVMGERHVPMQNPHSNAPSSSSLSASSPVAPQSRAMEAAPVPVVQQAPVEPVAVAAMDLPPVAPITKQIASERIEAARSMPEENIVLASGDYPLLSDVPQKAPPTGNAATAARLGEVRTQLESDRAAAATTKTQLDRDAAAEPSMLSDLPALNASPAPVPSKPIAPPVSKPLPPTSAVTVPPVAQVRSIADLPPPPAMTAQNGPVPIQMDSMPMGRAQPVGAAPIQLHAPVPAPVNTAAVTPVSQPVLPSASGSFDPMSGGSAPISLTAPPSMRVAGNYLPSSRYTYRR